MPRRKQTEKDNSSNTIEEELIELTDDTHSAMELSIQKTDSLVKKQPTSIPLIVANGVWTSSLPVNIFWGSLTLFTLSPSLTLALSIATGAAVAATGTITGIVTYLMNKTETEAIILELIALKASLQRANDYKKQLSNEYEIVIQDTERVLDQLAYKKLSSSKQERIKAIKNAINIFKLTESASQQNNIKKTPIPWKRYALHSMTVGFGTAATIFVSFFWGTSVIMTYLGLATASALFTGPIGIAIAATICFIIAVTTTIAHYRSSKIQREITQQRHKLCQLVVSQEREADEISIAKQNCLTDCKKLQSAEHEQSLITESPVFSSKKVTKIGQILTQQSNKIILPADAPNFIEENNYSNTSLLEDEKTPIAITEKKSPTTIPFIIAHSTWIASLPISIFWGLLALTTLSMPLILTFTIITSIAVAATAVATGIVTHLINATEIENVNLELASIESSLHGAEEHKNQLFREYLKTLQDTQKLLKKLKTAQTNQTENLTKIQEIEKNIATTQTTISKITTATDGIEITPTPWKRYALYSVTVGFGTGTTFFVTFFWGNSAIMTYLGLGGTSALLTGPIGIAIAATICLAIAITIVITHYRSSKMQREATQQRHQMCKSIVDKGLEADEISAAKEKLKNYCQVLNEIKSETPLTSSSSSNDHEEERILPSKNTRHLMWKIPSSTMEPNTTLLPEDRLTIAPPM